MFDKVLNMHLMNNFFVFDKNCNLSQNIVDKFSKFSKNGIGMECFSVNVSPHEHSNLIPGILGIFWRHTLYLMNHSATR